MDVKSTKTYGISQMAKLESLRIGEKNAEKKKDCIKLHTYIVYDTPVKLYKPKRQKNENLF